MKHILLGIIIGLILVSVGIYITQPRLKSPTSAVKNLNLQANPFVVEFSDAFITKKPNLDETFQKLVETTKTQKGTYSFFIKNLDTGKSYMYNPDQEYFAASLYKVPVALSVYKAIEQKQITLETNFTYKPADFYGGTGIVNQNGYGTSFSVEYLLKTLLKNSDNTSQSILLSNINSKIVEDTFKNYTSTNSRFLKENMSTPREQIELYEKILSSNYLSKESVHTILDLMSNTQFDDRISAGIPAEIPFSHKIGNWPNTNSWHDCGILNADTTVVACIMSQGVEYEPFIKTSNELGKFVYEVSKN